MRNGAVTLSVVAATVALATLTFSVAVAAPSVPLQQVRFTKRVSPPAQWVGERLTFELSFVPAPTATQDINVVVIDPNPAPDYLRILTDTIGGGAYYSPTVDGVVWEGKLAVGSLGYGVNFDVLVTGIPTDAPETGYVVTNTAYMYDRTTPGTLPLLATAQVQFRITPVYRVWLPVILRNTQYATRNTQYATRNTQYAFLPLVATNFCPAAEMVPSPFTMQIAALHQVEGMTLSGFRIARPLSEAEWLAMYGEAFPTLVEALKESGAGWARVRVVWRWIQPSEPPAPYVWGPYHDDKLRLVAETGVRLIATVSDAPDWAAASPCSYVYPERLDKFAQFLTDLVNRYKEPPWNIHHWELFNEPDGTWPNAWAGGLGCMGYDGDKYAAMLAVAYPAIKSADPGATVLMGGVAHDWFVEYEGPFYRYFPDRVMEAGGGAFIDVLNFHYFPDWHVEWERWDPGSKDRLMGWLPAPTCGDLFDGQGVAYEAWGVDLIAKTTHFRNRMSACFGLNKPVWVTELAEHGYPNNPASLMQQARYVIQGYARGLAAGAENITWYALVTPNDSYHQGLLYDDFSPKPAFYAYKTMTSELKGYVYSRTLNVSGVEGYVFATPCGQEKTVAWGSGVLPFAPAGRLRVVDRMGNEAFVTDGSAGDADGMHNGTVTLQLSADPVFVQVVR